MSGSDEDSPLDAANKEARRWKNQFVDLSQEHKKLQKRFDAIETALKERQSEQAALGEIKHILEKSEENNRILFEKNQKLKKLGKLACVEISQLNDRNSSLQARCDALAEDLAKTSQQLNDLQKLFAQTSADLETAKLKIVEKDKDIWGLNLSYDNLESIFLETRKRCSMQTQIFDSHQKIADKDGIIAELGSLVSSLKLMLGDIAKERDLWRNVFHRAMKETQLSPVDKKQKTNRQTQTDNAGSNNAGYDFVNDVNKILALFLFLLLAITLWL